MRYIFLLFRYLNGNSCGGSSKGKDGGFDQLLLDGYNGTEMQHQTVTGTNYKIKRSGLVAGGFTQPEVGMGFLKDNSKAACGFAQRFNFHFCESKHLDLEELTRINQDFKSAMVEDVMYPLLKMSNERGEEVMNYILRYDSAAYKIFQKFHNDNRKTLRRLSEPYVSGHDTVCAYIGKMEGKAMRESAVLTELLGRLKFSLDKRRSNEFVNKHSTPSRSTCQVPSVERMESPIVNSTSSKKGDVQFDEIEEQETFSHIIYNDVIISILYIYKFIYIYNIDYSIYICLSYLHVYVNFYKTFYIYMYI